MVYLCFIYEYIITLYFAIWMQSFGNYDSQNFSITGALFNTIFFTIFWVMMVWSHIESVRTKAGYLPKNKETLAEELTP